jgi:4-aminobutyrate aminotransferase-like enzyme
MTKFKISFSPQIVPLVQTKYRLIQSKIPAPGTAEIFDRLDKVESRSMHGQLPLAWSRADDFSIYDIAGNKWIDFTSSIFIANVGHSNKRVSDAIYSTLNNPLYSCYAYLHPLRAQYLEKLINFAGPNFEKAFLLSAGTEATEAAFKLMRMHGQKIDKRRRGIICIENNWHGRTLGAQMMSSNVSQRSWIGYQDADVHHIAFPYPWVLDGMSGADFLRVELNKLSDKGVDLTQDICGFMLEAFQGWGAVFYPKDFVQEIERICRKNNILLTIDEMQSGFGRTGYKFGYEYYGVRPDLICTGKGMGGGVPLSGVIGRAEIMDLPEVGNMSSTHSANPLVCAAGLAVLNEIEGRDLVMSAKKMGLIFKEALEEIRTKYPKNISYVLGEGMIMAVLFRHPISGLPDSEIASRIAERAMQKGLLVVHTGRESIKMGPPLTISEPALMEGVQVFDESISEVLNEIYHL